MKYILRAYNEFCSCVTFKNTPTIMLQTFKKNQYNSFVCYWINGVDYKVIKISSNNYYYDYEKDADGQFHVYTHVCSDIA